MDKNYKTVKFNTKDEFVEKRSRFIGYCKPVTTEQEAIDFINKIKKDHWDATHNVYAYSLREGQIKRYSDDGEPSGTAGMPALDVILKNDVVDVVVVVTRYFGGVLLGTGGLVRAYAKGCKVALEAANIVTMELCSKCKISCSYNQYGKINTLVMQKGGYVDNCDFADNVIIDFHMPVDLVNSLNKSLADATAGEITVEIIGENYYEKE
ncbi:MAG: YigZ family protein [Oscillospiraceae bacterium]|nr:YigZ family protein [Oscillospiraceae bacterium]